MQQYDVVKIQSFRNDRFSSLQPAYQRNPLIGDIGTIVEIYTTPETGFEVECSDPNGITIWLEAMYPEELSPI